MTNLVEQNFNEYENGLEQIACRKCLKWHQICAQQNVKYYTATVYEKTFFGMVSYQGNLNCRADAPSSSPVATIVQPSGYCC